MRTILFRGKRIDNGAWVEGDLMTNGSMRFISWIENVREHEDVIPETVGQFTGLLDKNGKKIFEGDLIKSGMTKLYVYWNEGKFETEHASGSIEYPYFSQSNMSRFEIIGNIHDK